MEIRNIRKISVVESKVMSVGCGAPGAGLDKPPC